MFLSYDKINLFFLFTTQKCMMNVILLTGILLRLPVSVYAGLIFSGYKYAGLISKDFTLLCYVSYIQRNVIMMSYLNKQALGWFPLDLGLDVG